MKQLIYILILFTSFYSFSQTQNLQLKERFDEVYINARNYWNYNPTLMHLGTNEEINANQCQLGSSFAVALDGLLIMYETTKEFSYLEEFMFQAQKINKSRADKITPKFTEDKYWCNSTRIYMNGRILWPLAHFVYLIQSDSLLSKIKIDSATFENKKTLGEFSDFINQNNREVMDFFMERYWIKGECMFKPADISDIYIPKRRPQIMELNMQSGFGCALIYMYLGNLDRTDYRDKAIEMADKFQNGKRKNKKGRETKKTILEFDSALNAYVWPHNGWRSYSEKYNEDIGHAAFDVTFALLFNRHKNTFTKNSLFDNNELIRFHNTFTKLIAKDYQTTRGFTYTVNGNYVGYYYGDNLTEPSPNDREAYNKNAKNWVELCEFDNIQDPITNNVYSLIMSYYNEVEQYRKIGEENYRPEGIDIRGAANMVKYQWKRSGISYQPKPFICK